MANRPQIEVWSRNEAMVTRLIIVALVALVAALTLLVWLVVRQIKHPQPGIGYMDTGVVCDGKPALLFGK